MIYISLSFYVFVAGVIIVYYLFPVPKRWLVLLMGNTIFYMYFYKTGWQIFFLEIVWSYGIALLLPVWEGKKKKLLLVVGLSVPILLWFVIKNGNFIRVVMMGRQSIAWIVPLGISFYTLQMIAYLVDVYRGELKPQKNLAQYILFVSFFPQLLQGPIGRYQQMERQLLHGHRFDEETFTKGIHLIIWGFFLKLVIADKAAVIVNTVFDNFPAYGGVYLWIAAVLYSIQLYTDFMACTTLSQGIAGLFGIELPDNFRRPYLAVSVQDFWRRWHISFSSWLKDYVYIPLGGNRKGKITKYYNLLMTFVISGIWHGAGFRFIVWGGLHALYQITGDALHSVNEKLWRRLGVSPQSQWKTALERVATFFLVTFAWVLFRADNLRIGLRMLKNMFTTYNPWILFNNRLFTLGLEWKECAVLTLAIVILYRTGSMQEKGIRIREVILQQKLAVRWGLYLAAIVGIMIFGTYGFGFHAQDFIYGGF